MRYLIIEFNEVYEKFEIEKKHLIDVQKGKIDMIIDTEEHKWFGKEHLADDPDWHDLKPYDRRFD